jgi:hypothetical protein
MLHLLLTKRSMQWMRAGLSQPAAEKPGAAAASGADTSADVDAYPGVSLVDKLAAATAQNK